MRRLALAMLACGAAVAAAAAPPPPPPPRDDLPMTLDGYDMVGLYGRYADWLEQHKGPIIDDAMKDIPDRPGYRPQAEIVTYKKFSDYGHYQSGEIRGYCRAVGQWDVDRNDCLFVLRKVNIPVAALDEHSPLGEFFRQSFDPATLVAALKREGVEPDSDVWLLDAARIFSELPSPATVLRANIRTELVDSVQCPQMRAELSRLEGKGMAYAVDMSGVGEDGPVEAPAPHSIMREDSLHIRTAKGLVRVIGKQRSMYDMLSPLYAAVDDCAEKLAEKAAP
ncbi:hypothetical protein [Sphingopyxis sp. QXT-31]|uniref:hypothetical protein n=1 Tax=Sphingopyxis sp. QXT-31 TaxID=1357916 RepID=UPI0012EB9E39|nr:hypothetical protein [Sphingopyxis sp. QXT-31]